MVSFVKHPAGMGCAGDWVGMEIVYSEDAPGARDLGDLETGLQEDNCELTTFVGCSHPARQDQMVSQHLLNLSLCVWCLRVCL